MPIHKMFSKEARLKRKGRRAGKKAAKSLKGYNVGIGVSGETEKAHKKAIKKTQRIQKKAAKFEEKGTRKLTQRGRRKEIGASKETKVSRGAKSVVKTKGGEYVKYAKKSKAAGGFRSAFKEGCKGDSKGFSWQGRKYSCAKK